MENPRDVFLQKFKPLLDNKEDKYPPFRAVLTSATGDTSSGSVWKNHNARLVWFRAWGSGSPAWALCDTLEPVLGLGVIIKYNPDINQYEVQRDDPIMRSESSDYTSYRAITNEDLLQGGRFQLWLNPTMFIPLSIYPTGADTVNVVSGDYILGGERLTFAGAVNQDISGSRPAAGFHRFVGFYLDSSATLGTIEGNTAAVGADAIEPAWPAGILRVGVVDIDSGTAISINDIDNRKVIYTEDDETGLLNVWPRAGEVNINYTPYASFSLAIDALTTLEQAIVGEGTYTSDAERIDTQSFLKGSGVDVSIIETLDKDRVLTLAKSDIILEDLTLANPCTATLYGNYYSTYIDEDANVDAFRVKFEVLCSGANINYGVYIASAGHHRFDNCIWNISGAAANYALYIDAQGLYSGAVVDLFDPDITGDVYNIDGTLNIYGGKIDGDVCDDGGCTINLYNLPLITGTVTGGNIVGSYIDSNGVIHPSAAYPAPGAVHRWDVSAGQSIIETDLPSAVANCDAGDVVILGAGAYTLTSQLDITTQLSIIGPACNAGDSPLVTITGDITGGLIEVSGLASYPFVQFVNLYLENIATTGAGHGLVLTNSIAVLDNCQIYAESGDDVADGVRLNSTSGTTRLLMFGGLISCAPATTGYAVNLAQFTAGTVNAGIYAPAYLIGDTADINAVASTDVILYRPILENVALNGAGTFYGEAQDPNGVIYYVADTTPDDQAVPVWSSANSRWEPQPRAGAEIYVHDNSTATTVATGAGYTKFDQWGVNGQSLNCTSDQANDKITITKTGIYRVSVNVSFYIDTPGTNILGAVFFDGSEQDQLHFREQISTANDEAFGAATGYIDVTSVPVDVDLRFRHDDGGNVDVTVTYGNLNVERAWAT